MDTTTNTTQLSRASRRPRGAAGAQSAPSLDVRRCSRKRRFRKIPRCSAAQTSSRRVKSREERRRKSLGISRSWSYKRGGLARRFHVLTHGGLQGRGDRGREEGVCRVQHLCVDHVIMLSYSACSFGGGRRKYRSAPSDQRSPAIGRMEQSSSAVRSGVAVPTGLASA